MCDLLCWLQNTLEAHICALLLILTSPSFSSLQFVLPVISGKPLQTISFRLIISAKNTNGQFCTFEQTSKGKTDPGGAYPGIRNVFQ